MTAIESFASKHSLKVTRDECYDQIISGRRGHLYFDGKDLCLMSLDATGSETTWQALSGELWLGSLWRDAKNRGRRDVWIKRLPESSLKKAMRLCGIFGRRTVPEDVRLKLAAQLKAARTLAGTQSSELESPEEQ